MKKVNILFALLGGILLGACSTDDNSYHYATVTDPSDYTSTVFADCTSDTITFETTDPWTAYSSSDWITIDPNTTEGDITYQYGYACISNVRITATPNTTGKLRTGVVYIKINGSDDFVNTLGVYYNQRPDLCIENVGYKMSSDRMSCTYTKTDTAEVVTDTLKFFTYKEWSIETSENSTVKVPSAYTSGKGGIDTTVPLVLTPNTSYTDTLRSVLTLVSNGVKTPVNFLQLPLKKKQ